jgi:sugar transferase (PEP-CTERM/EpsH1 system associated)
MPILCRQGDAQACERNRIHGIGMVEERVERIGAMRPVVMILTHRVPYPPNRGDRIRAFHLIRFLSKHADILLGSLADEPWSKQDESALREYCREVSLHPLHSKWRWVRAMGAMGMGRSATEGAFFSRSLAAQVHRWTSSAELDGAVLYCSSMGQYLSSCSRRPRKVVVDLVDVDSQKWADYASSTGGWKRLLYRLEASRVQRLEAALAKNADSMTVVTAEEAELYRSIHPTSRAQAVGNGVDLDFFGPESMPRESWQGYRTASPQMVFVGVLDYWPNEQGLEWFVESVMPQIMAKYPGARLQIVGRRPTGRVQELAKHPGVVLVGEVTDVRPYVLASHFVVAPLKIARGVQNKVLEGLACGRPVIATQEAATGIENVGGLIVANEPDEWLRAVDRLQDPTHYLALEEQARVGCELHYSWDAKLRPMLDLLGLQPAPSHLGEL